MTGGVLVAGIGNLFHADDGVGPEVARRLVADGGLPEGVRVVDYGIRGVHLAYDLLDGVDALILVDALPGDRPPGAVTVLDVGPDDVARHASARVDAHDLHPAAVLADVVRMGGVLPPVRVVGVQPADVKEGIGMSEPVAGAVDDAVATVRRLLSEQTAVQPCA